MIKRRISPKMNKKIERIPARLLIVIGETNKVSVIPSRTPVCACLGPAQKKMCPA